MEQIMQKLKLTMSTLQHLMDIRLQNYSLTRSQTEILMLIELENGIEHRLLLEKLRVTSPTLTSFLNELERRELLYRQVSETDARVRLLYLTSKGEDMAQKLRQEALEVLQEVFEDFSSQEVETLSELLDRIISKGD